MANFMRIEMLHRQLNIKMADKRRHVVLYFTLLVEGRDSDVYACKFSSLGIAIHLYHDRMTGVCENPDNPPGGYKAAIAPLGYPPLNPYTGRWFDTPEEAIREVEQLIKTEVAHRRKELQKYERLLTQFGR